MPGPGLRAGSTGAAAPRRGVRPRSISGTAGVDVSEVVLGSTIRGAGGVWRHILDLADGLGRRGVPVVLGLRPEAEALRAEARLRGLREQPLRRAVRRPGAVVHLHLADTYDREALLLLALARRATARVLTEHLPRSDASDPRLEPGHRTPGAHAAKTAIKRLHARMASIIAVSAGSADFLRARYGIAEERISVVPNGVAVPAAPARRAPRAADRPLRVVSVGSLIRQKGHDLLIDAVAHAERPWTVEIVGDGPQRHALEQRAQRVGADRVSFAGWSDDVDGRLAVADALCQPSRWEASSYAAIEALAAGLPVVATTVDGQEDIVESGLCGMLVPPERPVALARALDLLDREPARLAAMAERAPARAALFDVDTMVEGTIAVYRRLGARMPAPERGAR
jgi:glycosyltransferase involved in cell wall biosynthesis